VFLLVFILANMGLPGTVNFIGEFLVLVGAWKSSTISIFLGGIGMILGAVYAIWFYNRLIFGQIRFYALQSFVDLTRREFFILLPLIFLVFYMGIYPLIFLETFEISLNNYILLYK
jgi:NADH-quinone oxidoreductase subunit M